MVRWIRVPFVSCCWQKCLPLPINVFIYTRFAIQNFGLLVKLLRAMLCYLQSPFNVQSNFLGGGSNIFWGNFIALSVRSVLEVMPLSSQKYPLLLPGWSLIKLHCPFCNFFLYWRRAVSVTLWSFLLRGGLPVLVMFPLCSYLRLWKNGD